MPSERPVSPGRHGPGVPVGRTVVATAVWLVLTGGAADAWLLGIPLVAASVVASVKLLPRLRLSALGLVRFAGFFLYESLRGGVDVARRAFDPHLPLAPGVVEYAFRLGSGTARVVMTNTISLLPGTLGADLDQERLYVHVLDVRQDVHRNLELAERRVAGLFGVELHDPEARR